jgi:hypothetical protein
MNPLLQSKDASNPDGERKVLRRGLLASLAGLAAATVFGTARSGTVQAGTGSNSAFGFFAFPTDSSGLPVTGSVTKVGVWGIEGTIADPQQVAGVLGTSGQNIGVYGESGGTDAIRGVTSSTGAPGVRGVNTQNGTGVKGISNTGGSQVADGNGSGIGVEGRSATGVGVKGVSNSVAGVRGESTNGSGVLGVSVNQPGVDGTSTNSLGIRGTSTNFVGMVGISTNSHGLYGSTNGGSGVYGIVAENLGTNGPGLLVTGATPSQIFGGLQVFGAKNAVLKMQDGSFASVYCQESPEPYFEDFGKAHLAGGVASVALEREFATLAAGGEYFVFLTPEGDTRGLFVSRKGPGGFDVREVQGGTGNVPFTYRIVTRRKDIEGRRFARVSTEAAEKVAGVRAVLAAMPMPGSQAPARLPPVVTPPATPSSQRAPQLPAAVPGPGLTVRNP